MRQKKIIPLYLVIVLIYSGCSIKTATIESIQRPNKEAPVKKPEAAKSIPREVIVKKEEVIPEVSVEPAREILPKKRAGIKYSQVINLIGEFLDIQEIGEVSGEPKFLGTSENLLVTLEVIGKKRNIFQASMEVIYPKDINTANANLNKAMLLRFLRNIDLKGKHDWSGRIDDIIKKLYSVTIEPIEEDEIGLDRNSVGIIYDRNVNSIRLTVKRR